MKHFSFWSLMLVFSLTAPHIIKIQGRDSINSFSLKYIFMHVWMIFYDNIGGKINKPDA